MKKALVATLCLYILNSAGCERQIEPPPRDTPDSTRTEFVKTLQDSTKDSINVSYYGQIRCENPQKEITIAKLLDFPQYAVQLGGWDNYNGFGYIYTLPTFQVGNARMSFITDKPVAFTRGANYSIKYWKLLNKQDLTEENYFRGFVAIGIDDFTKNIIVNFSKKIDTNIEGVITDIQLIGEK